MAKKILFLTASAGEGHNSMCRALSGYLKETYEDVDIVLYDLYKDGRKTKGKKRANWLLGKGYFLEQKFLFHFGNRKFNQLKNTDFRKKKCRLLRYNFISPAYEDVKKLLAEFQPDSIFCSHTFAGIIINELREKGDKNAEKAKTITIVSDFDVAPYTELLPKLDYFISPTKDFEGELIKRGIDSNKITTFGIPIQTKFSKYIDKQEAKNSLKLIPNLSMLLLMGGGLGFGNMAKMLKCLDKCKSEFQIVCVCGKNNKLKNKIESMKKKGKFKKNIFVLGFTNEVDVLMSAADVLVSKAGGLSTSEAFNKNLPIIITKKLPHQENDNCKYLTGLGVCEHITKDKLISQIVDQVLGDKEKYEKMKQAIRKVQKPNATRDIGNLLYYGEMKKN